MSGPGVVALLRARLDAVAIALSLLAFDLPLLRGRAVWGRDVSFWLVPSRWLLRQSLSHAELPRWDHTQALGAPILANPLHGVFYPPTLLSLLDPLPWWTSVFLWGHALLGALGLARLASRMGCSAPAAATAGVVWALSGPLLSEWTAGMRLPGLAWLPWITLGAWALAARPSWRAVPALALPIGMSLLAGEPFMTMFGLLFAAATLPAAPDGAPWDRSRAARVLVFGAAAVALGLGVAAASLGPTLAAASGTQRAAALDAALAQGWSVHPARLLDLLVPGGLREASERTLDPRALRWCDVDPLLFSHYVGATSLGLAAAGLRRDRRTLALTAVCALALLCALGRHAPAFAAARALLPPLRFMRTPEKFVTLVPPAVALLAALGVDRLRDDARRALRALVPCAALLAVALVLPRWLPAGVAAVLRAGAWRALAPLAAMLLVASQGWRAPRAAPWGLAACVLLDLGASGRWLHPWRSRSVVDWRPPVVDLLRARFGPARAPAPPRFLRARTMSQHADGIVELPPGDLRYLATLPPNTNTRYGVGALPSYDVAVSPALEGFLAIRRVDVARLLSVDATLQPARAPGVALPRGLSLAAHVATGVDLLAIDAPLPRAYAVGRATVCDDDAARARALDVDVVAGERALVSSDSAALDGSPGRVGACAMRRVHNGEVDADCALARDGLVVFVEGWSPGWRARVDGRSTAVQRANLLVMGVRVGAGRHRVALRYAPPGVRPGLALSALALAAVAAIALRTRPAGRS